MKNTIYLLLFFLIGNKSLGQNKIYELDSAKYGPGKVYYKTDKPSSFPGGNERIAEFFKLKFDAHAEPPTMTDGAKEGKVTALFIVEPNGKVKYVEITKHYTNAYDEEMVNTLLTMPKWEPAMINNKPVRSFRTYSYALTFYMR
jgi:hypothetical protein